MAELPSRSPLGKIPTADLLLSNMHKLSDSDRKFLSFSQLFLGGSAAVGGLLANAWYRSALNVTRALVASSLPMAVTPFLSMVGVYDAAVFTPLLTGDLSCPICVHTRGALVGALFGCLHPAMLALFLNMSLATRFRSAPVPHWRDGSLRYMAEVSRPVLRRIRPLLLLNVLFGVYVSNRHHEICTGLAKVAQSPGEELRDD